MNDDTSMNIELVNTIIDISNIKNISNIKDISNVKDISNNIMYVIFDTHIDEAWVNKDFIYKNNQYSIWNDFLNIKNKKLHSDIKEHPRFDIICCGTYSMKHCCTNCLCFVLHSPKLLLCIALIIVVVLLRIYILQ